MLENQLDDVSAIGSISAVPSILNVLCESTGLRFATVARVTPQDWVACAVLDRVGLGLAPGDHLNIADTLCSEVCQSGEPVIIDHASQDARYREHHVPKMYGFESYIAMPIYRKDGSYFGNLCGLDPLPAKLSDPKVVGMVSLFAQLISVQLEAEERHSNQVAALLGEQETAEIREQFIAVLGHDLRTPLHAVNLGAELIIRQSSEPAILRIAERIRTSTLRMSRLVNDVLDFARGRMGASIALNKQRVDDLGPRLEHIISEHQSQFPHRRVEQAIAFDGDIECDAERIGQLFSNLLGNAFAHGAPGTAVRISASNDENSFTIAVSNAGTPIPAAQMPRLFQPFHRGAEGTGNAGLGLGLYIADLVARAHDGRIQVRSTIDEGTTFTFTAPIRARHA